MKIRRFIIVSIGLVIFTALLSSSTFADTQPNDPEFPNQWYLDRLQAPAAWDLTRGDDSVVVAILSTGIRLFHSETYLKLWRNTGEISGNGIDDDDNGYVDDVWGWDYTNDDNVPDDGHGFGTMFAGIVGAHTNNRTGVAGVSWGVRLMPLKVVDDENQIARESFGVQVPQAIRYALDNGGDHLIIMLPFDFENLDAEIVTAIDEAYQQGAIVIAPVGDTIGAAVNSLKGSDSPRFTPSVSSTYDGHSPESVGPCRFPACLEEVIAVAGTTRTDEYWGASLSHERVDIGAPAQGISVIDTRDPAATRYGQLSSTYLAAPQVAGLAALLWSLDPSYTNHEVEQILKDTAVDLGVPGWDEQSGYGRVDAYAAVRDVWDRLYPFHSYLPLLPRMP